MSETSEARCCPLSGGDHDGPVAFTEETVTARKEHKCYECRGVIPKGERYLKESGIWDGRPDRYKTCLLCAEIRTHFACQDGWLYGQLWSDLEDNFFPDMTAGGPCMEGLSPAAKQFLIDRRMDWYMDDQEHDGAPPPQEQHP